MSPSTNQRRTRTSPGDYTGMEKAKQQRQMSEDEKKQRANTTLAGADDAFEEEFGVFDGESGQRLDTEGIRVIDDDDDEPPVPPMGFGSAFDDEEPVFTGEETEEQLAPILAERDEPRRRRRPERPMSEYVIVRFDQDIDDMTYGVDPYSQAPKNYTFKEGLKYKVRWDIAQHLDERGLVRQWVRT